jgi:CHAT domain-containing protein
MWVARLAILLCVVVIGSSSGAPTSRERPHQERLLDSLFHTARYDTILQILPAMIRDAQERSDSVLFGRLTFQRGRVYITLGKQDAAERDFDASIRLAESERDTLGLLHGLHFKAFVLRDKGRYDEAMANFERELMLARRIGDIAGEVSAVMSLAYRDLRRGDLESAREGYQRCLDLLERIERPDLDASVASGMGLLCRELGDIDGGRRWFRRTWTIARAHGYRMQELWAMNNLGLLEADAGNMDQAARYFEAALGVGREIGFARGQALPVLNLALAWSYLGERTRALAALDESRAICERAGFDDLEVLTTMTQGDLYMSAERYGAATALYREILGREFVYESLHRHLAASNLALALAELDSVDTAVKVVQPFVMGRAPVPSEMAQAYVELTYSDLLRQQHRYRPALQHAVLVRDGADGAGQTGLGVQARLVESACWRGLEEPERAVAALGAALDSMEVARARVGDAQWREAYGQHVVSDIIDGCRVLLEHPASAPGSERETAFYDTLQRFKTRTLLERIRDPRSVESTSVAGLTRRSITLQEIQEDLLKPGDLLLDLFVGERESYLFVVSQESRQLVELPGANSTLAEEVELYRDLLSSPSPANHEDYPAERLATAQQALGEAILGGAAAAIARAKRVIVAPDGFMTSIPFGTLIVEGTALADHLDIVHVPSATVLQVLREESRTDDGPSRIVALSATENAGLPGATEEVEDLAHRYRGVARVGHIYDDVETSMGGAGRNDILHIAAHARVNDESPWQSGFWFDQPGDSPGRRGSDPARPVDTDSLAFVRRFGIEPGVRAWEIARSRLPFGLAVLSACGTAGGRVTTGEGVLGLTSAFMSAGVPVVVASLWPVDDAATARLMKAFYEQLGAGQPVAAALRLAQAQLRRRPETAHPFYWAGFVVIGDGSRVMPLERTPSPVRWFAIGSIILLAFGAILLWSQRRFMVTGN